MNADSSMIQHNCLELHQVTSDVPGTIKDELNHKFIEKT